MGKEGFHGIVHGLGNPQARRIPATGWPSQEPNSRSCGSQSATDEQMSTAPKLAVLPPSPVEPHDILTPQELAKRLKVPLSWVYKQSARRGPECIPVLR